MSAIWPDPEDCNELGLPVSVEGLRVQLQDVKDRAEGFRAAGRQVDAARARVFVKIYEDELAARQ